MYMYIHVYMYMCVLLIAYHSKHREVQVPEPWHQLEVAGWEKVKGQMGHIIIHVRIHVYNYTH